MIVKTAPKSAAPAVSAAKPGAAKKPAGKVVAKRDPHPGADADPRSRSIGRRKDAEPTVDHAPADHPQLDHDNRGRERINRPDSRKGKRPAGDHKRNDRTPKQR